MGGNRLHFAVSPTCQLAISAERRPARCLCSFPSPGAPPSAQRGPHGQVFVCGVFVFVFAPRVGTYEANLPSLTRYSSSGSASGPFHCRVPHPFRAFCEMGGNRLHFAVSPTCQLAISAERRPTRCICSFPSPGAPPSAQRGPHGQVFVCGVFVFVFAPRVGTYGANLPSLTRYSSSGSASGPFHFGSLASFSA
jgi:hypothetical protein